MPVKTPITPKSERSLQEKLEQARAGNERAFEALVEPHLREIHVHCYRMLGSITDAEDLVQEALIAAWSALDGFAGRASFRTWLYRIATNRCHNAIRDAKRRIPPEPVPPFTPPPPSRLGEVPWLQPYPDTWLDQMPDQEAGPEPIALARESIELAFVVALQRLPPRQVSTLLLCDVLGFSIAEAADTLDTSAVATKGLLQRARASIRRQPDRTEGDHQPVGGAGQDDALARRFASAMMTDDFGSIVALLTNDAWLAMPPALHEYHGPSAIVDFLKVSADWRSPRGVRFVSTRANRQPALAFYHSRTDGTGFQAEGLIVLTCSGSRIRGITRFLDPALPGVFGLPEHLDS